MSGLNSPENEGVSDYNGLFSIQVAAAAETHLFFFQIGFLILMFVEAIRVMPKVNSMIRGTLNG
jgi:hypothetical protein